MAGSLSPRPQLLKNDRPPDRSGVVFCAIALAIEIIAGQQSNGLQLIPALLWIGAALHLIPEETSWRHSVIRGWMLAVIPIFILTLLNAWFSLFAVFALLGCVVLIASLKQLKIFKNTFALLLVIGLFFSPLSVTHLGYC